MIRRFAGWYRSLSPLGRARFWTAVVFGFAAIGLAIALRQLKEPWEGAAPVIRKSWMEDRRQWLTTEYYVQVYEWWAACVNLGIVLVLGLTSPLWVKWAFFATKKERPPAERAPRPGKLSLWILAGAIVLGAVLRIPLLQSPILYDEQDNLRRNILGFIDVIPEAEDNWVPATWQDAFFENRTGNNPALFSVLSRGCLVSWRAMSGASEKQFHLVPFRLPSLVAGLLTIPVLWLVLRRIGLPRAADIGAVLFAIHPMVIDYHYQARGYGLAMLFILLSAWFALKAIEGGKFLHWLGVAFSLVFALYSFSGAIYFYAATLLIIFAHFGWRRWREKDERPAALSQMVKFTLAMAVAGMVFLQLILPNSVQARYFLKEKFYTGEMASGWYLLVWGHYTTGVHHPPTIAQEQEAAAYVSGTLLPEYPVLSLFLFIVSPVLVVAGFVRIQRRRRYIFPILYAGAIATVFSLVHSIFFTHHFLNYWYFIYALPLVVMAMAAGVEGVASWCVKRTGQPWLGLALPAAVLVLFVAVAQPRVLGINLDMATLEPRKIEIIRSKSLWTVYPDGTMTRQKGVISAEPAPGIKKKE